MSEIRLHFDPLIHSTFPSIYQVNYKTKCELTEEKVSSNESAEWRSGQEFVLDTALFRGKGSMRSRRQPSTFPMRDAKYVGKESIIRIVGHFKEDTNLNELFLGGTFDNGVRGLPAEWITNIGIQIARNKSPHFCIRVSKNNPYVAVPFICLVDDLMVEPFHGQSAQLWKDFDLAKPIVENWATHAEEKLLTSMRVKRTDSSELQKQKRQALRNLPVSQWIPFQVQRNQFIAFEIVDSALVLEELVVRWRLANFIPISVDLKHYINELPLSIWKVKCSPHKGSDFKHCSGCGTAITKRTSSIPLTWQKQGLCDACFPPKTKSADQKFIFALHVTYHKKKKPTQFTN